MAFPNLHGIGQLVTDPKTGPTKTGGTWTNAVVKFVRWAKGDSGGWVEADSTIAAVIAFDDVAAALAQFAKGDTVDLLGTVSAGIWNGNPQLKITVGALRRPEDDRPKRAVNRGETPAVRRDVVHTSARPMGSASSSQKHHAGRPSSGSAEPHDGTLRTRPHLTVVS